MSHYREPPPTLGTAKEWFEETNRRFLDAVQRVMTARDTAHPFGAHCLEIDWSAFREEIAHLHRCAEERHAAKHRAVREALLNVPLITAMETGSAAGGGE